MEKLFEKTRKMQKALEQQENEQNQTKI